MNERAKQPRRGLAELTHQISAAAGPPDGFADIRKNSLDLFIELISVRNDHHTSIWIVLKNPFGQKNHNDAFTAALRMPNNSAFSFLNVFLRCLDGKILVGSRKFFN